jgi:hypothetical protein
MATTSCEGYHITYWIRFKKKSAGAGSLLTQKRRVTPARPLQAKGMVNSFMLNTRTVA